MIKILADSASDAHQWSIDGMVWTFGSLLFSILLIMIVAWYAIARFRAKAALTVQAGHQKLADDAVDAQYQTSTRLTSIDKQLAEIGGRLAKLETVLREVE